MMEAGVQRARAACERGEWHEAYRDFMTADAAVPLQVEDLERLATAAYLLGRETEFHRCFERAHRAHVDASRNERAARAAFWLAMTSLLRRETGQANAWAARGMRLVEKLDCVERGYLQLPAIELALRGGDFVNARAGAADAAQLGERHAEADLVAAARHMQGRAAIHLGDVSAGFKLLDESMLGAIAGELSPVMTGLMYCSVISVCRDVHEIGRAREWTAALSRWCSRQSGMVAFTDTCTVHRAEVLQFLGAWPDAFAEVRRVCERCVRDYRQPPGAAWYQQGEIHRLRGEYAEAEEAYRTASNCGCEPQPGLALLRLAQGRKDAACAALRRLAGTINDRLERAHLLPALIEVMLASGDVDEAVRACDELDELAQWLGTDALRALVAQSRGAIAFQQGDSQAAQPLLRQAFEAWRQLDSPYEAARVRALMSAVCRALGDDEAAGLEMAAAHAEFQRLGALPDLARLEALMAPAPRAGALSPREVEVLRLIAGGQTNKGIANELHLSERTIDRHVSNILGKLGVPSRAAAIAYGYSHQLL